MGNRSDSHEASKRHASRRLLNFSLKPVHLDISARPPIALNDVYGTGMFPDPKAILGSSKAIGAIRELTYQYPALYINTEKPGEGLEARVGVISRKYWDEKRRRTENTKLCSRRALTGRLATTTKSCLGHLNRLSFEDRTALNAEILKQNWSSGSPLVDVIGGIEELLDMLKMASNHFGDRDLPRGASQDFYIRNACDNLKLLWTELTGKQFRGSLALAVDHGGRLSFSAPAPLFAQKVFQAIDPDVDTSQMRTHFQKSRSQQRKSSKVKE